MLEIEIVQISVTLTQNILVCEEQIDKRIEETYDCDVAQNCQRDYDFTLRLEWYTLQFYLAIAQLR